MNSQRQWLKNRGLRYKSGVNTYTGRDQTIHAACEGIVKFTRVFAGGKFRTSIHVIPATNYNVKTRFPKPIVYNPEQFPDLAENNPEPYNFPLKEEYIMKHLKDKRDKVQYRFQKLYTFCTDLDMDRYLKRCKFWLIIWKNKIKFFDCKDFKSVKSSESL